MRYLRFLCASGLCFTLFACNSGGNSSIIAEPTTPPGIINNLPVSYQNLPLINSVSSTKLAYAQNGYVGNVGESAVQNNLQSMAVALSYGSIAKNGSITGLRYCTGTPIYKKGNLAFVLTAAHCVVGNPKSANTRITTNNIVTFALNKNYINQTNNAFAGSTNTGEITAVYLPQNYCYSPNFVSDGSKYYCSTLEQQDGDIALVKVNVTGDLKLNPQVKLPDPNLSITPGTLMLTLGYGITNFSADNTQLYYINYEYFATNSYGQVNANKTILNGYNPVVPNQFYSIVCGGDSGGGDFYWDGANWNLVGVHSFGSRECGQAKITYQNAFDASGDVRLFVNNINNIINSDTSLDGCASAATQNGFICKSNS